MRHPYSKCMTCRHHKLAHYRVRGRKRQYCGALDWAGKKNHCRCRKFRKIPSNVLVFMPKRA